MSELEVLALGKVKAWNTNCHDDSSKILVSLEYNSTDLEQAFQKHSALL